VTATIPLEYTRGLNMDGRTIAPRPLPLRAYPTWDGKFNQYWHRNKIRKLPLECALLLNLSSIGNYKQSHGNTGKHVDNSAIYNRNICSKCLAVSSIVVRWHFVPHRWPSYAACIAVPFNDRKPDDILGGAWPMGHSPNNYFTNGFHSLWVTVHVRTGATRPNGGLCPRIS
jgi:hypothetical protein